MIIRREPDTLLLLTQPDHARLAAELLGRWQHPEFTANPRRDVILLAVREHDNGWREPDDDIVFDAGDGQPLDFIHVPDEVKQGVWPRGVDRLAEVSAYAAALVARHAVFVFDGQRGKPEWTDFFRRMEARVEALRERAGINADTLEGDYRYLAVADLLSLAFCNAWAQPQTRFDVTVSGIGNRLTVSPPVLGDAPFVIRIRARRIPARRYASAADVRAALLDAPPVLLAGEASGTPR